MSPQHHLRYYQPQIKVFLSEPEYPNSIRSVQSTLPRFTPPQELRLKFLEGAAKSGNNGGADQMLVKRV